MKRWSRQTGELLVSFVGHSKQIIDAFECEDDNTIISSSYDNSIRKWDAATGLCLLIFNATYVDDKEDARTRSLLKLTRSGDHTFAAGLQSGRIFLKRTSDFEHLYSFVGHKSSVLTMCELRDGSIVSASGGGHIKRWKRGNTNCIQTFVGPSSRVTKIVDLFSGDCDGNNTIATCSQSSTIQLWEVETGHCLCTITGHEDYIKTMTYLSKEELIMSSSYDYTVRVWNKKGDCLSLYDADAVVSDIVQLRDGMIAFSIGMDTWKLNYMIEGPNDVEVRAILNKSVLSSRF